MNSRSHIVWVAGAMGLSLMASSAAWASFPSTGCGNCHAVPTAGGAVNTCSPTFNAAKRQTMANSAALFGVTYTVDQINAEVTAQCGGGTTTSTSGTTTSTSGATSGATTSTSGATTSTRATTSSTKYSPSTTQRCYSWYCSGHRKPHRYDDDDHGRKGKGGKSKHGRNHHDD